MNKTWHIINALAISVGLTLPHIILSCAPEGKKPSVKESPPPIPFNLEAAAQNGRATLSWQVRRSPAVPISGYNIYISEDAAADGNLYNSLPYPGDTDDDTTRESIEIPNLTNGKRYYVYLKTVIADGRLTPSSEKISFLPLRRGQIKIKFHLQVDSSGYSFSLDKYTPAHDYDNDIHLFFKDDRPGISSPSLLHPSLRRTVFCKNCSRFSEKANYSTSLRPVVGEYFIARTESGATVELKLLRLEKKWSANRAIFEYVYYPAGAG